MKSKMKKILSISALATGVFLWDFGVYMFFDEFVAKLFLVIILISGAGSYYEFKRAIEIPSDEEPTANNQTQIITTKEKTEQND